MAIRLAFVFAVISSAASAWGPRGHMVVAAVAWNHLTPAAKTRVKGLLRLNPDYAKWTKRVAAAKKAQIAFISAATWPDAIKSESGYSNDGEHPSGPDASRNIGYEDHLQHRYWHFTDLPFSTDGTPLVEPVSPNAETQIEAFRYAIADPSASDNVKSYDLVWLIHLVGDVHQPLHATSRFSHDLPQGDRGGNLVKLCDNCRDELHGFWDDVPGASKSPTAAIAGAKKLPLASNDAAAINDDKTWIDESFVLAKSDVYVDPIGPGTGPYTLTAAYKTNAQKVASGRLELGGERLADLINANLH